MQTIVKLLQIGVCSFPPPGLEFRRLPFSHNDFYLESCLPATMIFPSGRIPGGGFRRSAARPLAAWGPPAPVAATPHLRLRKSEQGSWRSFEGHIYPQWFLIIETEPFLVQLACRETLHVKAFSPEASTRTQTPIRALQRPADLGHCAGGRVIVGPLTCSVLGIHIKHVKKKQTKKNCDQSNLGPEPLGHQGINSNVVHNFPCSSIDHLFEFVMILKRLH